MISLTATELPRFMACNGFKMLKGIEPFNISTEQTDEGIAAHWLCEQVSKGTDAESLIGQTAPNGIFITVDMVSFCKRYIDFLKFYNCEVEVDTSYSSPDWEVRGRADAVAYVDERLIVADLKYGWRIVEPEMNWTLLSHAMGYLLSRNITVKSVEFAIFQPRPYHPEGQVREWKITYEQLCEYYEKLTATLNNPESILCTGRHCYKCKSLSLCPAAQMSAMNAVGVSEKAFNSEMSNEELSYTLKVLKEAQEALKQSYDAYQDLALHRLYEGQTIRGYSISPALGNTTWNEGITSDFIKTVSGVDVRVDKIMTPAQAKKAGVPEELINSLTHRPDNGFKLVAVDENKLAEKLLGKRG